MNINEASIFETLESEVRSYCRDWPAVVHQRIRILDS